MRSYLIITHRTAAVVGVMTILGVLFLWAVGWTGVAALAWKHQAWGRAQTASNNAQLVVTPLSWLTFHRIPDIEIWHEGLNVVSSSSDLVQRVPQLAQEMLQVQVKATTPTAAQLVANDLATLNTSTSDITLQAPRSLIGALGVNHLILQTQTKIQAYLANVTAVNNAPSLDHMLTNLQTAFGALTTGNQNMLILFQNSDELRATGGFIGSYAALQLQNGQLHNLDVQDIYEADGQFHGLIPAPPGVQEYLSSDHGLRLPDANWWPNFANSANQISHFFVAGKGWTPDHILAINLRVAQDILRITGGIYLPDYQTTATADNLTALARQDRASFFPGSQQKRNFLASLFTQLKLRLMNTTPNEQLALAELAWQHLQNKDIQLFSLDPAVEKIWQTYGVAGQVAPVANTFSLMSVESNVGINKANKAIDRRLSIQKQAQTVTITLTLQNHNNPAELEPPVPPLTTGRPLNYIDYQRFVLPAQVTVQHITVNGQAIPNWQTDALPDTALQQTGFLVPIPVGQTSTVSATLALPADMAATPAVFVQKQSGINTLPVTVEWDGTSQQRNIQTDAWFRL